jgi:hypothetical protein
MTGGEPKGRSGSDIRAGQGVSDPQNALSAFSAAASSASSGDKEGRGEAGEVEVEFGDNEGSVGKSPVVSRS